MEYNSYYNELIRYAYEAFSQKFLTKFSCLTSLKLKYVFLANLNFDCTANFKKLRIFDVELTHDQTDTSKIAINCKR